jgi:tRNA threonylcarbamoyladenosine biosynthesis protein TsaB
MFRVPKLDRNTEGGNRKHASALHPRGRRGASGLNGPFWHPGYIGIAPEGAAKRFSLSFGRVEEGVTAPARSDEVRNSDRTMTLNSRSITAALREPTVLALDSAGSGCSVVVAAGENVLAAERCTIAHGQAERLLVMVDAVMRKSGLSTLALDIVGTTIGPGSFTGIRVGLAAVRGIALATGARSVGVTGFEAVASGLCPRANERENGFLLVALESRREDIYIQLFDYAHRPLGEPSAAMPRALARGLSAIIGEAPLLVAGDAAQRAANMLLPRFATIVAEESGPDAAGVLRAVLRRARASENLPKPLPLYLRPPDVTVSTAHRGGGW